MAGFIFILWLLDALSGLDVAANLSVGLGCVLIIVSLIGYFIESDLNSYTDEEEAARKLSLKQFIRRCTVGITCAAVITVAVPSRDTMDKMVLLYAADTALELEVTQKALDGMGDLAVKGSSAINKLLDSYLEAEGKEAE